MPEKWVPGAGWDKDICYMEVEKFWTGKESHAPITFGAKANDRLETSIDLNEQLVRNKPATCFMRVTGSSMIDASIYNGDIVIVDRSIKAENGKIVIVILDGEMLIRRFEKTINRMRLIPETTKLSPIDVCEFNDCKIWGVVTYVIHSL
jgi:DNA polymerase V